MGTSSAATAAPRWNRCPAAPSIRRRATSFARDIDAGANFQALLVSAVAAVLLTRLYLRLTGYPRIGSGSLHIAHLLWGGLLMVVALVIFIAVLGKRPKRLAAVVGGLGLGLFIDEIGKFVTADNDYFFQPAIALIYVLFIALFLVFRAIEHESFSAHERLANVADLLRDIVLSGGTRTELARARLLLDQCGLEGPVADALRAALASARHLPDARSPLTTLAEWAWRTYDRILEWPWLHRAIWLIFIAQALIGLIATAAIGWMTISARALPAAQTTLATSSLSLILVLIGVVRLRRSRLDAYRWFERSILISIFFTQVILFWQDELTALSGLAWDLVLLAVLHFSIRQEIARTVTQQ